MCGIQGYARRTVQVLASCLRGQTDDVTQEKRKKKIITKRSFRLWLFRRRGKQNDMRTPFTHGCSVRSQRNEEAHEDPTSITTEKKQPSKSAKDSHGCVPPRCQDERTENTSGHRSKARSVSETKKGLEIPATTRKVTFHEKVKVKVIKIGTAIPLQRSDSRRKTEALKKPTPVEMSGVDDESNQQKPVSLAKKTKHDTSTHSVKYPEIMEITRRVLHTHSENDSPSSSVDLTYPDVEDSLELWFRRRAPPTSNRGSSSFSYYGHLSDASSEDLHAEKTESDESVYDNDFSDPGVADIPLGSPTHEKKIISQLSCGKWLHAKEHTMEEFILNDVNARRVAGETSRELFLHGIEVRRQFRPGHVTQPFHKRNKADYVYGCHVRRLSLAVVQHAGEGSSSDSDF